MAWRDRTRNAEAPQSPFDEKLKTGWRGLLGPLHWQVHFGIVACRRSLPQVQHFIDYLEDALAELEDTAGMGNMRSASRKRVAKPKENRGTR